MSIKDYGWNEYFENEFKKYTGKEYIPGRIVADYGPKVRVVTEHEEVLVDRPKAYKDEFIQMAAGDWIVLKYYEESKAYQIQGILPRKTKFSRAAAGIEVKEQIVAANVDVVFLIQSLNKDFNLKRLERYMITAWESQAMPVVVLTKADCCENVEEKVFEVNSRIPGVDVHAISCFTGEGIPEIMKYLAPGKTIALLGSSGVGKSTLLNYLAGKELLKTGEIREHDDKGRHTTTHRELILLPNGGLILDTPGMRELLPWEADSGMDILFGDIEELAKRCRFADCRHEDEPGCAIREALENGTLDIERFKSWSKLQKEMASFENRKQVKQKIREKQIFKQERVNKINKQNKKIKIKNMELH